MSRKKCTRCDSWMFEQAVVCPHCGADQNALDPLMRGLEDPDPEPDPTPPPRAPLKVNREEAAALTGLAAANAPATGPSPDRMGVTNWLIMPQSSGARLPCEIVLTVVAMPLILITLVTLGWWAFRFRIGVGRGEAWLAAPVSAAVLFCLLMAYRTETWAAILFPGVMLIAWLLRGLLRKPRHALL